MAKRAFEHSLGRNAVFFQYLLLKRAAVHSYPYGDAAVLGGGDELHDLLLGADIARIDPYFVNAILYRKNRETVIKMDIGNEGYMRMRFYVRDSLYAVLVIDRKPDDFTAGFFPVIEKMYSDNSFAAVFSDFEAQSEILISKAERQTPKARNRSARRFFISTDQ